MLLRLLTLASIAGLLFGAASLQFLFCIRSLKTLNRPADSQVSRFSFLCSNPHPQPKANNKPAELKIPSFLLRSEAYVRCMLRSTILVSEPFARVVPLAPHTSAHTSTKPRYIKAFWVFCYTHSYAL